jgi:XTP/dITP diphosphohydrolase
VREILSAALGSSARLVPRPDEVPEVEETGDTLEENVRLKAAALCRATGLPAMADDTGLEVKGIHVAPGVYSSRYAGERATYADNVAKLLSELSGLAASDEGRQARFRTVAVCVFPDGREIVAEGTVSGRITVEARGASGFGYDPVFVPDEGDGRTFAEMSRDEKHSLSHRGRAFRLLAERLLDSAP